MDHDGRRTTELTDKYDNGVYSGKVEFENKSGEPP
jgi:hypothetical protein